MRCSVPFATVLLLLAAGVASAEETNTSNLAPNPSFEAPEGPAPEAPDGWSYFVSKVKSISLSRDGRHSGEQCLQLSAQKVAGSSQGILLELPVEPKERYTFSVFLTNNRDDLLGGSASGELVIEWKNAEGKEVARSVSRPWTPGLSRLRWEPFSISKIKVPTGATRAVFGIHLNDGDGAAKGSVFVDDVLIERD
ncbi:MAG: hypothetical protein BWK77_04430 [Verrucomicrobia bacterium A1]|nr:MAG: hypothetical protein BWK77_04430 [Verrucomicrobia bacterium A1]